MIAEYTGLQLQYNLQVYYDNNKCLLVRSSLAIRNSTEKAEMNSDFMIKLINKQENIVILGVNIIWMLI